MKNKLWNITVILLLATLAWAFYSYWKVENVNNKKEISNFEVSKNEINIDEKSLKMSNNYSQSEKKIQNGEVKNSLENQEVKILKEIEEPIFLTEEEVNDKTEELYDELLPVTFDSDIEEMDLALVDLDIKANEFSELVNEEHINIMEDKQLEDENGDILNMETMVQSDVLPEILDEGV